MQKVYITTHDPITYYIYDKKETIDTFGEDFLLECGKDIPEELLAEHKKAYDLFWSVQDKIAKFLNK